MLSDASGSLGERELMALDQHAIVSIADARGDIIYVNDRFCEISGYARDEVLGRNHRILKSGEHGADFYRSIWRTILAGKVWRGDICNRRKDGQLYWVESTITPFLDDQGKPWQFISIRTDISHVKAAEAALRASEARLNYLVASSPVTLYTRTLATPSSVTFVSQNIERLLGRSPGELTASRDAWLELVHPEDRPSVLERQSQLLNDGLLEHEYRLRHCSGDYRWIRDESRLMEGGDQGEREVIGYWMDISRKKTAEHAAKLHKERMRRGQMYANIGTWDWDIQRGTLYWTERIAPLFGYPDGDLETNFDNFIAAVHPEDRQAVLDAIDQSVGQGVPYEIEHRVVWPDGTVRWLMERGAVHRSPDGEPLQMLGVVQDIHDRKSTEQALIAARLEADRANQAKSDFLSSMSHELRTPMNAILGFAQLMQYDQELPSSLREDVEEILKAGHHLLSLINEVLDLAKVESGSVEFAAEPLQVGPVLEECTGLVAALADKRGIVISSSGDHHLAVLADRTRFKQAVLNLISNAIKYNRELGGVLLDVVRLDTGQVRIQVIDSGPGVPEERQQELFQPFCRLGAEQTPVEGTGIGLTISRRIVEMMGGRMGMRSTLDVGSSFWIELPYADFSVAGEDPRPQPAAVRMDPSAVTDGAQQQVLYIEDNPANLRLVAQILGRRRGISLATASTPEEGLQLAREHPQDLILLDINMPGMTGYQVLELLKASPATRDVPVVAVTANAMPQDIAHGLGSGFVAYLTKPLQVHRFLAIVDEQLPGQGAGQSEVKT